MYYAVIAILCVVSAIAPGFSCSEDGEMRSHINSLQQTIESERQHAVTVEHARKQAVSDAERYRKELLAERTRRGWSDTYALASAGVCLVAFITVVGVVYYRRREAR